MALPQVVEVTFGNEEAGTKKVTHHLLYNSWAIRELERITGKPVALLGLMIVAGRAGMTESIQILWAGLEGFRWRYKPAHHAEPFTLDEVSLLVDDTCSMSEFKNDENLPLNKAIKEAFESAFPNKKREEGPKKENPPTAEASTGMTSSTPPPS